MLNKVGYGVVVYRGKLPAINAERISLCPGGTIWSFKRARKVVG